MLADFLISKKEIKEKYPSYMYLPKHFIELENNKQYFLVDKFHQPSTYVRYSWEIHVHVTNKNHIVTTEIKNNEIESLINGNYYDLLNYDIFSDIVDAKVFIIDDITKDLL